MDVIDVEHIVVDELPGPGTDITVDDVDLLES